MACHHNGGISLVNWILKVTFGLCVHECAVEGTTFNKRCNKLVTSDDVTTIRQMIWHIKTGVLL